MEQPRNWLGRPDDPRRNDPRYDERGYWRIVPDPEDDPWTRTLIERLARRSRDASWVPKFRRPDRLRDDFLQGVEAFTAQVTKGGTDLSPEVVARVWAEANRRLDLIIAEFAARSGQEGFRGEIDFNMLLGQINLGMDDLTYELSNYPPPESPAQRQRQAKFLAQWEAETGLLGFVEHRVPRVTINHIERLHEYDAVSDGFKPRIWYNSVLNMEQPEQVIYALFQGECTVTSGLTGRDCPLAYRAQIFRQDTDILAGQQALSIAIVFMNWEDRDRWPTSRSDVNIEVPMRLLERAETVGLDFRYPWTEADQTRFTLGELRGEPYVPYYKYLYLQLQEALGQRVMELLNQHNLLTQIMAPGLQEAQFEVAADLSNQTEAELDAALLAGLHAGHVPEKLLYVGGGAERFRQVVYGKEYKMETAEGGLMAREAPALVALIGSSEVIDLGCFDGQKIEPLLAEQVRQAERAGRAGQADTACQVQQAGNQVQQAAQQAVRANQADQTSQLAPVRYHALDISPQNVYWAMETMRKVQGVKADGFILDYEKGLERFGGVTPKTVALLGTLANYPPAQQRAVLGKIKAALQPGDHILLGVQLKRDVSAIEAMYDNAEAKPFGIGPLVDRLGIRPEDVDYQGQFNEAASRMEMKVTFRREVRAGLAGKEVVLPVGQELLMVVSHKYEVADLPDLLSELGLMVDYEVVDPNSNQLLVLASLKN